VEVAMTIPAEEARRDPDMVNAGTDAGGNLWAAVRALLEDNERLEGALQVAQRDIARLRTLVSPGYGRLPPTQH
jgi:hypothetical protein